MVDANYYSVPWASTAEWSLVRDNLFSGIPTLQKRAIDRIDAWRCRAPRSLPVSIISTVDLLRLALLDGEAHLDPTSASQLGETHLRLAYSMALVRFVNLSTEMLQKKTAVAVHMLAGDIGLPEWLVNIRHEATHYTLPSMDLLRNGVSVALEWLKLTYWDEQAKDLPTNSAIRPFAVDDLPGPDNSHETSKNKNLKKEGEEGEERMEGEEEETSSLVIAAWSRAEFGRDGNVIDWRRVPIGILPGQSLTYNSLDLPETVDDFFDGVCVEDLPSLSSYWHEDEGIE